MGIDIYAIWKGQTEAEMVAQCPGFSTVQGHVGYLREAYHGEPYATQHLCREAFESGDGVAAIPAATLRERLPRTLQLVEERERVVYQETNQAAVERVKASFADFVALCERKERETGQPVDILASF